MYLVRIYINGIMKIMKIWGNVSSRTVAFGMGNIQVSKFRFTGWFMDSRPSPGFYPRFVR